MRKGEYSQKKKKQVVFGEVVNTSKNYCFLSAYSEQFLYFFLFFNLKCMFEVY